jgi:L-iditol 2-dehydrogenase
MNMANRSRLMSNPKFSDMKLVAVSKRLAGKVSTLRVGRHVVIDQGLNCVSLRRLRCGYCQTGDSHQCEFYAEHGITGLPGGLAEFIAVPAVKAVPFPCRLEVPSCFGRTARLHRSLCLTP